MKEFFKYYPLEEVPEFFSEINEFIKTADPTLGFQQWFYPENFSKEFIEKFKPWFEKLIEVDKIKGPTGGFVNATKYVGYYNETVWHNENSFSNGFKCIKTGKIEAPFSDGYNVCFFWLSGDTDCGGALRVINDHTNELEIIHLNPPGFMLATVETLHSVAHYFSTNFRVNFTVDFQIDQ